MLATNILALPLAHLVIEVANNEDWVDSLVFVVSGTDPPEQLDLRGIAFEMHIRRQPEVHEIVLDASTADRRLSVGSPPNIGFLIFYVPQETMKGLWAGKYVGDVRARDLNFERVVFTVELTVIEGITRS
jgi:hypothetical protein